MPSSKWKLQYTVTVLRQATSSGQLKPGTNTETKPFDTEDQARLAWEEDKDESSITKAVLISPQGVRTSLK